MGCELIGGDAARAGAVGWKSRLMVPAREVDFNKTDWALGKLDPRRGALRRGIVGT